MENLQHTQENKDDTSSQYTLPSSHSFSIIPFGSHKAIHAGFQSLVIWDGQQLIGYNVIQKTASKKAQLDMELMVYERPL